MNPQEIAARIVEEIFDMEALLGKLKCGTARRQTWQQQLHGNVRALEGLVQILRMTIMMDRPASEQLAAARDLSKATRMAALAVSGSRADQTTLATVKLIDSHARHISDAFEAELRQSVEPLARERPVCHP